MSKARKTSMDEKAANDGDRLKHPITLEVLGRCSTWPSLTYAETHAGAGRYLASGQRVDRPHIVRLQEKVAHEKRLAVESEAGGRYLGLLRDWWDDANNEGTYPGEHLRRGVAGCATGARVWRAIRPPTIAAASRRTSRSSCRRWTHW